MKTELDKEKRIVVRSWAKREKQLQTMIFSTAGMYGDLQGLIGSSMQTIPALESDDVEEAPVLSKEIGKIIEESEEQPADIPLAREYGHFNRGSFHGIDIDI